MSMFKTPAALKLTQVYKQPLAMLLTGLALTLPLSAWAENKLTLYPIDTNNFSANWPTVVITHGLQDISYSDFINQADPKFIKAFINTKFTDALTVYKNSPEVSKLFNVGGFVWSDAFQPCDGYGCTISLSDRARFADNFTPAAGFQLAQQLFDKSNGNLGQVHLIGHSLGTHVNAFAALVVTGLGFNVDQVTVLDRPFGNSFFPGPTDTDLFKSTLSRVQWVDNYYGMGDPSEFNNPGTGWTLPGAYIQSSRDNADRAHSGQQRGHPQGGVRQPAQRRV